MRAAMIGAGWIAADHVERIGRSDGLELAAICDLDEGRARALAGGAAVYTDWREMIDREGPDALFVCTPPMLHREPTLAALSRGIHVYLEKPIARGLEDARAIVDAASSASAVCAVGYQWRGVAALDLLRDALAGQEIGLLIGIGRGPTQSRPWFLDRAQGGGNLLERASHIIDLERAVAGEVVAAQGAASPVPLAQSAGADRGDIEDAAALILRFEHGAVGAVQIAWTRDGMPREYALDVLAGDASLHLELDPTFLLAGRARGSDVEAGAGTAHPSDRSLARFVEAARSGDRDAVFCTPAQAAGTLAVVLACEEAVATGSTVDVAAW
jgi:myo-inositol 2-dehydrogenase / D-chiro-inositol 1-dehydrogenase